MVKLAQVPNVERTTAVLVDEQQVKRHSQKSGIPFRCIYLDQLLGKGCVENAGCEIFLISVPFQESLRSERDTQIRGTFTQRRRRQSLPSGIDSNR